MLKKIRFVRARDIVEWEIGGDDWGFGGGSWSSREDVEGRLVVVLHSVMFLAQVNRSCIWKENGRRISSMMREPFGLRCSRINGNQRQVALL